jgi:arylsulfatase A-like enzyme
MDSSMHRRRFMGAMASVAALANGCGGGGGASSPPPPPPGGSSHPNVLMIAIDDLNDWVGYLGGHPQVKTPAMDALAKRSTAFARAYCNAPVCSASRASALTGLTPQQTGVFDLDHTFRQVNPGKPMMVDMLRAAGYSTAEYGKVDHNFTLGDQPLPTPIPYANKECSGSDTLEVGAFDWGPAPGPDSAMPDYRFGQQAIDFLQQRPIDSPFYLAVGFVRTHVGWYVPQRFFDMYPVNSVVIPEGPPDDLDDLGPAGKSIALMYNFHDCITRQNLWADAVRAYLASISWVDSQIARVIAALDASPHADNTVVVLWSDHGFHLGEKFHWHKLALWERCTRIPFLIREPAQSSGQTSKRCVSLVDMAPTILDYAGVQPAYPMSGTSLKPLIASPTRAWDRPVLITKDEHDHAIRTEAWRYIRYTSGERELYGEAADPGEISNLANVPGHDAIMAELDALMPPKPAG